MPDAVYAESLNYWDTIAGSGGRPRGLNPPLIWHQSDSSFAGTECQRPLKCKACVGGGRAVKMIRRQNPIARR